MLLFKAHTVSVFVENGFKLNFKKQPLRGKVLKGPEI